MAWIKVGENLVRYNGGTIYLRAKIAGKIERLSLKTSDLKLAKLRRGPKLAELRRLAAAPAGLSRTMGEAIDLLELAIVKPHLKKSSRDAYAKTCKQLRESIDVTTPAAKWGPIQAAAWWKESTDRLMPGTANGQLHKLRILAGLMIENQTWTTDPTAGIKPMKVKRREMALPSREQIEKVIEHVRAQPSGIADLKADYLAFLAFSGCRIGESQHIGWENILGEWLVINGGEEGTKNRRSRRVPISPALAAVIERLRHPGASGAIFPIYKPSESLADACRELGMPHLRIHDLRHWFASWCIENGIEIPTIARWLGHQDGGALLMRTYGHLRDAHSLEQAKRLE